MVKEGDAEVRCGPNIKSKQELARLERRLRIQTQENTKGRGAQLERSAARNLEQLLEVGRDKGGGW